MTAAQDTKAEQIARLNDRLRREGIGGRVMMTSGVAALTVPLRAQLVEQIRAFSAFTADDDPWREHDFGIVELGGTTFFWQIAAYDLSFTRGSPDPTDSKVTQRVLTIMRADEY